MAAMQVLFGTVAIDCMPGNDCRRCLNCVILVEIEKFFIRLFMPKTVVGVAGNDTGYFEAFLFKTMVIMNMHDCMYKGGAMKCSFFFIVVLFLLYF